MAGVRHHRHFLVKRPRQNLSSTRGFNVRLFNKDNCEAVRERVRNYPSTGQRGEGVLARAREDLGVGMHYLSSTRGFDLTVKRVLLDSTQSTRAIRQLPRVSLPWSTFLDAPRRERP